jgi:hypothetical protein
MTLREHPLSANLRKTGGRSLTTLTLDNSTSSSKGVDLETGCVEEIDSQELGRDIPESREPPDTALNEQIQIHAV